MEGRVQFMSCPPLYHVTSRTPIAMYIPLYLVDYSDLIMVFVPTHLLRIIRHRFQNVRVVQPVGFLLL